jgi:hypothetical protein
MPVTIPATGSGSATPVVSTDNVTADSTQVQNVQLVGVSGGALTRTKVASGGELIVTEYCATTALTNVASSASNVNLLAANTAREGATIFNDSTAVLYVKLGTTASATSFTVKMSAGGYYEVPFGYAGNIDGIWSAANGYARVTELT